MGKVSQRIAEGVKVRVEHLAAAAITRESLDEETARWVSNLPGVLRDKLADVGLVPRRGKATLGQFLASYIDGRTDVKGGDRDILRTHEAVSAGLPRGRQTAAEHQPGRCGRMAAMVAGRSRLIRKHDAAAVSAGQAIPSGKRYASG